MCPVSPRAIPVLLLLLAAVGPPTGSQERDGVHDFDWEVGGWTTTLRYLANPLSPEPDRWRGYRGSTEVRPAAGGLANLAELDVSGPAGRIRGLSLRLYEPESHQWSLNFANMLDGRLTSAVHGGFDAAGRGLFSGQDEVGGRAVLVRFVITPEGRDRIRFTQAYSPDAGATWEENWVAIDQRR